MGKEKLKNLFLVLAVILVIIAIPYLIYTLGSLIQINYFGYINNWWIVLLFLLVLVSIFVLRGINFEKKMGSFFLILFAGSFFILGINLGVKPNVDPDSYTLFLNKEAAIVQLDETLIKLENDLLQLKDKSLEEHALENPNFKNHEIIFFAPGSASLSDFNKRRITAFLSTLENCTLNISGYSDGSGNKTSNMDISKKRAQSVADFINTIDQQNNTINKVTGFGDDYQLADNANEISRAKNRRVTIEIIGKTDDTAASRRKEIEEEMTKTRAAIKSLRLEKDSLRDAIFHVYEE